MKLRFGALLLIVSLTFCLSGAHDIGGEPTEEWNRTFGGSDYEWGESVIKTSDGGYLIIGGTSSYIYPKLRPMQ